MLMLQGRVQSLKTEMRNIVMGFYDNFNLPTKTESRCYQVERIFICAASFPLLKKLIRTFLCKNVFDRRHST